MATAAEEIQGGEGEELQNKPVEGEEGQGGEGGEDNGADSPYAELAQKIGWVPKDQFEGPPEAWKPADQFILDGRDIQRETSRELKTVRQQLDTIARTSASIVEQQVNERVAELSRAHQEAVEEGDPERALKIATKITELTTDAPQARQPSPDAQDFAQRNSAWFNKPGNEYATSRAIEICNTLAGQGYDAPTQLRIAEQRLRVEMPQLFEGQKNGKPAPGVNQPGSRGSGVSNRAKGFSDMPVEAQKIAKDMADRGVIKSVDDYAKNYFANLQGKA